jgi:hypothetical protein
VNWSAIFVALYLVVGCFQALEALLMRFIAGRFAGLHPMGATLTGLAAGRQVRIGWARNFAATALETLPLVVTWPAMSLAFRGRRSVKKVIDLRLGWPLEVFVSVWVLIFSVVIALLVEESGRDWVMQAACYAVVGAAIAIPARTVMDGSNLREELRRTLRNPFMQFVLVAAANFAALAIAASILLQVSAHSPFSWGQVWPEALQILKFGHISAIWKARPTRIPEILVAAAALAVYALLVSQLTRLLQFRRTDDDRIEISIRLMLADDSDGAERWLRSVGNDNPEQPGFVRASALHAIKTGDFVLALQRARAIASLRRQRMHPVPPEDSDDGRRVLAEWAEFFIRADYGELYSQVVDYLIADGISDACLATVVPMLLFFEREESRNTGSVARMMRQGEQIRLASEASGKPNAKLEAFARERAKIPQFPAAITDPPYPLAVAMREARTKQLPKAAARLRDAGQTRRLPGQVVKRVIAGHIITEAAADAGHRSRILEAAAQEVVGLLDEAQKWPVSEFPFWLRQWLLDEIDEWVRLVRPAGSKRMVPALRELRRFLAEPSNANRQKLRSYNLTDLTEGKGAVNITKSLRTVASYQSVSSDDPRRPRIVDGPVEARTVGPYNSFRYCVKRRWRHHDIYVYIDKAAPRQVMKTAGQAALEGVLNEGDTPGRIYLGESGKLIAKRFPPH